VWDTYPLKVREKWTEAARDNLLNVCAKSGVIGELVYVDLHYNSFNENQLKGRAGVLDKEWCNGILALEGGQPDDVGRFPDKDGRFDYYSAVCTS
jgi:hypothetical protein